MQYDKQYKKIAHLLIFFFFFKKRRKVVVTTQFVCGKIQEKFLKTFNCLLWLPLWLFIQSLSSGGFSKLNRNSGFENTMNGVREACHSSYHYETTQDNSEQVVRRRQYVKTAQASFSGKHWASFYISDRFWHLFERKKWDVLFSECPLGAVIVKSSTMFYAKSFPGKLYSRMGFRNLSSTPFWTWKKQL